jgi:hypothetical protein
MGLLLGEVVIEIEGYIQVPSIAALRSGRQLAAAYKCLTSCWRSRFCAWILLYT